MQGFPLGLRLAVSLLGLCLILVGSGFAGEQTAGVKIAPKADKIVRQLSETIKSLESLRLKVAETMKVEGQAMKQEVSRVYDVAMERPNKLAVVLKSGMMGGTIVCDGKKLYVYLPVLKKYTVRDAPAQLEELEQEESIPMMLLGMGTAMTLGMVASSDLYETIMEGVTGGQYVGREKVGGLSCHRLRFAQEAFDWEMWLQADGKPLPRKIVVDLSKGLKQAREEAPGGQAMKIIMTVELSDWQVNPRLSGDVFKFSPPADAQKVETFFEGKAEEKPHALLGKRAPDFKLPLLEGGQAELKAHKGKHVVMLDFWATWCGPCRRALPEVARLADRYKGKGVVFYAVNLREEPDTIRKFLKREKIAAPVALDKDGKVAEAYEVRGIPTTVLIGKDGVVQAVHVGFAPGGEKTIESEIEKLLEGKSLVKEPPRKDKKN